MQPKIKLVKAHVNALYCTSHDQQASVSARNVYVHDTTIRKRLNGHGFHESAAMEKALLSKKERGSTSQVSTIASEQTTKDLKQYPLY